MQDKFRLDISEEEAIGHMNELIDQSASAVMAALAERIHKWAKLIKD